MGGNVTRDGDAASTYRTPPARIGGGGVRDRWMGIFRQRGRRAGQDTGQGREPRRCIVGRVGPLLIDGDRPAIVNSLGGQGGQFVGWQFVNVSHVEHDAFRLVARLGGVTVG